MPTPDLNLRELQDAVESSPSLNRLWHSCFIKPLLDIVVNNTNHHKLETLFYYPPSASSVSTVAALAELYPFMKKEFTIVTSVDRVGDFAPQKTVVAEFGAAPQGLAKFDLLIVKCCRADAEL